MHFLAFLSLTLLPSILAAPRPQDPSTPPTPVHTTITLTTTVTASASPTNVGWTVIPAMPSGPFSTRLQPGLPASTDAPVGELAGVSNPFHPLIIALSPVPTRIIC
jgi:hypothetical protein